jgi:hypothetical protein
MTKGKNYAERRDVTRVPEALVGSLRPEEGREEGSCAKGRYGCMGKGGWRAALLQVDDKGA